MRARPATEADADLLLAWRNDPGTGAWSFNSEPVPRPEHLRWLTAVLADPDRRLLIVEDGGPVGTVRFDRDGDAWKVNITVAPGQRGRGLSGPVLACAEATLDPGTDLVAWVHPANAASVALFERAGYHRDQADGEWLRWVKRLT